MVAQWKVKMYFVSSNHKQGILQLMKLLSRRCAVSCGLHYASAFGITIKKKGLNRCWTKMLAGPHIVFWTKMLDHISEGPPVLDQDTQRGSDL
ncbi:unnamed protein product [Calypogeia fissa]